MRTIIEGLWTILQAKRKKTQDGHEMEMKLKQLSSSFITQEHGVHQDTTKSPCGHTLQLNLLSWDL